MNTVRASRKAGAQHATQTYLRVAEIHDNTLVLKSGGLRAVLRVDSVNLNLKNEDEQKALTAGYQQCLNSLEFPVQLLVRSRKMDVGPYLERLRAVESRQRNECMQQQVAQYTSYIEQLVDVADIMRKEFYVVIPLDPFRAAKQTTVERFWQFIHPADSASAFTRRRHEFANLKKKLDERVQQVTGSLANCSLTAQRLITKELVTLWYESYNPLTCQHEKIDADSTYALAGAFSELQPTCR